jgi:hypothetical protein
MASNQTGMGRAATAVTDPGWTSPVPTPAVVPGATP